MACDCLPHQVDLREDPKEGVVLTGAQSTPLTSVQQAVGVIEAANRNRVTSATAMNDASSRSHSVFALYLHGTNQKLGALRPRKMTTDVCH